MSAKKKNSNYVTAKTEQKRAERERELRLKKTKGIIKNVLIIALIVAVIAAAVVGVVLSVTMQEYTPVATDHVEIQIYADGKYSTLHVELYGNDAPETVKHFLKQVEEGYYEGRTLHSLRDGLLYGGSITADGGIQDGLIGEFSDNGRENRISHTRGVISMARGEENMNSAYGQFFITCTDDAKNLDGKYAAFAKITGGMEAIDEILVNATPGTDGLLPVDNRATIISISTHHAH